MRNEGFGGNTPPGQGSTESREGTGQNGAVRMNRTDSHMERSGHSKDLETTLGCLGDSFLLPLQPQLSNSSHTPPSRGCRD